MGSNLGDRLDHLRTARKLLLQFHEGSQEEFLCSSVYETEPVDCTTGSGDFFNAVMEMECLRHPIDLLDDLQAIEQQLGRPRRRPRNAPRPIDLDILYAGNLTLNNEEIIIPHPRFHLRRFVLEPLAEIRPDLLLPGQTQTTVELLHKLPPGPRLRKIEGGW